MRRRLELCFSLLLVIALTIPALAQVVSPNSLRAAIDARYPGVSWVSTSRLAHWMSHPEERNVVILDIREQNEFAISHLQGAQRVAPNRRQFDSLGLQPSATIVVYCSVGYRSAEMALRLQEAGFPNVYNLQGGIFQWANEGRTVYRGARVVHQVHPYDATWGRMLMEQYRSPI